MKQSIRTRVVTAKLGEERELLEGIIFFPVNTENLITLSLCLLVQVESQLSW